MLLFKSDSSRLDLLIKSVSAQTVDTGLHVIMTAAYGYDGDYAAVGPGHKISLKETIRTTINNFLILILCPTILLNLPFKPLRDSRVAYREFGRYLRVLVDIGKRQEALETNILQTLVQQAKPNPKERVFSDEEIIGNAFIFLIAGSEPMYAPLN